MKPLPEKPAPHTLLSEPPESAGNETQSALDDSTSEGQIKLLQCPLCGASLFLYSEKQEASAVAGRHPYNECPLAHIVVIRGREDRWNQRIEPSDPSRVGSPATGVASQNPSSTVADNVEAAQVTLTFQTFPDAEGYWLLIRDRKPHLYAKLVWVRQFDGDWRQQERNGAAWWPCHEGTWFQLPLDQLARLFQSEHGVSSPVGGALPEDQQFNCPPKATQVSSPRTPHQIAEEF